MAAIPFELLYLCKQFRADIKPMSGFEIIGYDTETIDGRAELIADSYGRYINPENFLDVLKFLCRKSSRGTVGFFYNLKYDFQAVLKWLEPKYWLEIYKKGEVVFNHVDAGGVYELFYIPQKFFKIRYKTKGNKTRTWSFYDISQYFGRMKLDNAAKKYLDLSKADITDYDLTRLTLADMKNPDIVNYCIQDAILAVKLSRFFIDLCSKMGLETKNFSSPASISVRYFSSRVKFPSINRFIKKKSYHSYIRYAWECTTGAFINVFKRGFFDQTYVYDINSCYPYQMTQLPDISKGVFSYRQGKPERQYTHGWLKARVNIGLDDIGGYSPCLLRYRRRLSNFFPIGDFSTYLTLMEYDRLKKYIDIDIIDGIYWQPKKDMHYFLSDFINELYNERLKTKDVNIKYFIKIVLNGLYGKFLEKHEALETKENKERWGLLETGNLFNPFFASYILAGSRLQLFDAIIKTSPNNLIACSTDSVMTKEPIDLDISKNLGAWGLDHDGEALVIGCGVYSLRDSKGDLKTKLRGFHTVNVKADDEAKRDKFDLFNIIEKQPNGNSINIDTIKNITPLSAIIQKIPEDMNLLLDASRRININFDTKRLWTGRFKRAKDLLTTSIDSLPIDINLFN